MPILPTDFLDTENAKADESYSQTHGLPKRVIFPDSDPPGTLLIVNNREPFSLSAFKSQDCDGSVAISKDAYLLWRLSERYGQTPFPVGLLDKDRIKRLRQLRAIEFDGVGYGGQITSQTLISIQWDRMPMRSHFDRLIEGVSTIRNDTNLR